MRLLTEKPPSFDEKYSGIHQRNIWEGHFYKVNVCGSKKVQIKSEKDKPCDSKYGHCISFDKGACIEIIQQYNGSRYTVLK